jgi:shikimate kinase
MARSEWVRCLLLNQEWMRTMRAVVELEREIRKRQDELAVLKHALATLKGIGQGGAVVAHRGRRRQLTEAEKRKLSAVMKKVWQKRKAAQKANQAGARKTAA